MRGVTLLELVLTLVLVSLLTAVLVPGITGLRDRLLVERHAARLVEGWHRARAAALVTARPVVLRVASGRVTVVFTVEADSSVIWSAPGPAADQVDLVTTLQRVVFSPNGLTMGVANGRMELSRGGIRRALVASRLGRLRVERPHRRRQHGDRRTRRDPAGDPVRSAGRRAP